MIAAKLYETLLLPLLFQGLKVDPETAHRQLIRVCGWLSKRGEQGQVVWLREQLQQQIQFQFALAAPVPELSQQLWGLTFPNPVGLAAGFDKDGVGTLTWPSFGFGFAEVGTVTQHAQPGNPRPRLFRLPADWAAINRMGFNNQGAAQMAAVLQSRKRAANFPIGINLGKSKVTPLEAAASDYLASFRLLKDLGDYFVVNVSSPNTPGLRSLQSQEQLFPILDTLQQENQGQKPLLVKIAPDLEWSEIAEIIELAQRCRLAGMIATNTTISRQGLQTTRIPATGTDPAAEAGGLSGAPVRQRSTEVIRFIYQQTGGKLPIIGVGGIASAADAWEKILAGASLVQIYTGWFYQGPWLIKQILTGLQAELENQKSPNLAAVVGTGASLGSKK
jgi:dihydroorotate dehydrogenase